MFDVTGALPAGTVSAIEPGSTVLVTGPPMSGKRALAIDLLTAGSAPDGVLWIETDRGGQRLERVLLGDEAVTPSTPLAIATCSRSDYTFPIDGRLVERVGSPSDLTGISIAMAKLRRALVSSDVGSVRYGLHNLSTLVNYLDPETVFKFLHIFTGRIASTEELGVFTLDEGAHDQRTITTIASEFDGMVELRDGEEGRELRVKGFDGAPSQWQSF